MSLQILLVDDEPAIKIGFRQLTDWVKTPYSLCATASNGEEALAYVRANPVDIIITDLKMSVMDGIDLIRALKQEHLEIPIMVLSNYSDFELVREALTAGAVDYLLKANISADLLMEHLDKIAINIQDRQKDREETLKQKRLLELQNEKILLNELRHFFLDETVTQEELSEETTNCLLFSHPCVILTLFFHEDIKREKLRKVAPNIQTLLIETLSLTKLPVSIMTHHNEILYCVSANAVSECDLLKKTKLLLRQIATYFDVHPVLCCSNPAVGLTACRSAYLTCVNARNMTFYNTDISILFTKDIHFVNEIPGHKILPIVEAILNFMRSGKQQEAFQYIHETLTDWASLPLDPLLLRMKCAHIFESVALSGDAKKLHTHIHDYQQKLLHAINIDELESTLREGLSLLQNGNGNEFEKYKREVQVIMRYVNMHYKEHITLDEIARAANLNRSYLCRLFKKEYGDSIFNYLNSIRMEKAAEMLRSNPNLYVQEVAAAVGICEPFYFTRRFKEYFGVSPRDFVIHLAKNKILFESNASTK